MAALRLIEVNDFIVKPRGFCFLGKPRGFCFLGQTFKKITQKLF